MPGPGRSKGCYRCRSKKVKCDELRPSCKHCQDLGVKCPGYRPENELVFCNMNDTIENRIASRPRTKQKSSATAYAPTSRSRDQIIVTNERSFQKLVMPEEERGEEAARASFQIRPSSDWPNLTLCRFFADYIEETNNLHYSPGFLDNLPMLYNTRGSADNVLEFAMSAVSFSNYGNQVNSEEMSIMARKSYGNGLAALNRALTLGHFRSDQVLAGVVILNMYEMFSGDKPPQNSVFLTHGDALGMLLRARGTSDQFVSKESGGINRAAHRIILFKNLIRRIAPGPETTLWEKAVDRSTLWNKCFLACNRISRLLPVADSILKQEPSLGQQSQQLLHVIGLLQAENAQYRIWETENSGNTGEGIGNTGEGIENTEGHQGRDLISRPPKPINSKSWLVHSSRNVYRAARIILLQTLLSLELRTLLHQDLGCMKKAMQELQLEAAKDTNLMVTEISQSADAILDQLRGRGWSERGIGDGKAIAGYTCMFPLSVAIKVKTTSEEQIKHIGGQLQFIARTLGIRQARTIRNST